MLSNNSHFYRLPNFKLVLLFPFPYGNHSPIYIFTPFLYINQLPIFHPFLVAPRLLVIVDVFLHSQIIN